MPIVELLDELDARWSLSAPQRVPLRIFGSMALMLRYIDHLHTIETEYLERSEPTEIELPSWI